jgi:hypothetical protein
VVSKVFKFYLSMDDCIYRHLTSIVYTLCGSHKTSFRKTMNA